MSFIQTAKSLKDLSYLFEGREKIETSDVIDTKQVIWEVDIVDTPTDHYAVLVLVDMADKFLFGGKVITSFFDKLVDAYGTLDTVNANMQAEGGLPVEFFTEPAKKKGMNPYTNIRVLDHA